MVSVQCTQPAILHAPLCKASRASQEAGPTLKAGFLACFFSASKVKHAMSYLGQCFLWTQGRGQFWQQLLGSMWGSEQRLGESIPVLLCISLHRASSIGNAMLQEREACNLPPREKPPNVTWLVCSFSVSFVVGAAPSLPPAGQGRCEEECVLGWREGQGKDLVIWGRAKREGAGCIGAGGSMELMSASQALYFNAAQ